MRHFAETPHHQYAARAETAMALSELRRQLERHRIALLELAYRLEALRSAPGMTAHNAEQPARSSSGHPSAAEIVRELREQNEPSRQRVLRAIERLREIADAQRRAAGMR